MEVKDGVLYRDGKPVPCPFSECSHCGIWCIHCQINPRLDFRGDIPTKLFGIIPWEKYGWVQAGHEAVISCGCREQTFEVTLEEE